MMNNQSKASKSILSTRAGNFVLGASYIGFFAVISVILGCVSSLF